jgi:two-component system chemotaxis sensor kinase CheA
VDALTREFIAESNEGLERMESCLTELERRPGDRELIDEIFRSVHTIKGTTGFLGFTRLETLAHAGENLLGALREQKLAVTSPLIGGLLELMDGLRAILRLIETTGDEGQRATDDDHDLIARLMEWKEEGASGTPIERRASRFDASRIESGSPPAPSAPVLSPPDQSSTPEPASAIAALLIPTIEPQAPASPASVAASATALPSMQDKTLRIDVEVVNRMMNLVGELVLTRNQILQSKPSAENFSDLARRLDIVTADLRESVMQARMQPVGHLFSKFPRMVRDLARTCGRKVRIEFEGQETGLDKSLLEAIRDPLTHSVRNAVDHGIETEAQRRAVGKPAEGLVRLRAFHHSGSIVIEVIDDGAGIRADRVLAKAIDRGLITSAQAEQMTEREALRLIFIAGFSTTTEVTSVSGRGIGMDVVRANVEMVGGSVEIESIPGRGTTLRLRVPLTLAIVPALVVRSGGQSFALPQSTLAELIYVPRREAETAIERIGAAEFYHLRDRLLPLVWLDRLLALAPAADADAQGFYIAVVESEACRFGLVVDDLKAPEEIVVKPLSCLLREIGVFSGATVLGNGLLAMILDIAAVGERAGVRPLPAAHAGASPAEIVREAQPPIPMEDSMVVFEIRAGHPMAMPLNRVERIETVPIAEIEFAGGRPLLQYRGDLLPLEDEGQILSALNAAQARPASQPPPAGAWTTDSWRQRSTQPKTIADPKADSVSESAQATVLICLRPGAHGIRRVGVVVLRVLDVSAGMVLAADQAICTDQLAMVGNRVTTLHGGLALPALQWQEVA